MTTKTPDPRKELKDTADYFRQQARTYVSQAAHLEQVAQIAEKTTSPESDTATRYYMANEKEKQQSLNRSTDSPAHGSWKTYLAQTLSNPTSSTIHTTLSKIAFQTANDDQTHSPDANKIFTAAATAMIQNLDVDHPNHKDGTRDLVSGIIRAGIQQSIDREKWQRMVDQAIHHCIDTLDAYTQDPAHKRAKTTIVARDHLGRPRLKTERMKTLDQAWQILEELTNLSPTRSEPHVRRLTEIHQAVQNEWTEHQTITTETDLVPNSIVHHMAEPEIRANARPGDMHRAAQDIVQLHDKLEQRQRHIYIFRETRKALDEIKNEPAIDEDTKQAALTKIRKAVHNLILLPRHYVDENSIKDDFERFTEENSIILALAGKAIVKAGLITPPGTDIQQLAIMTAAIGLINHTSRETATYLLYHTRNRNALEIIETAFRDAQNASMAAPLSKEETERMHIIAEHDQRRINAARLLTNP